MTAAHSSAGSIATVLGTLRRALDMDVAFVGEFLEGERIFRHVDVGPHARAGDVVRGDSGPLGSSFCLRIAEGSVPAMVPDVTRVQDLSDLLGANPAAVASHAGVPLVRPDGTIAGTLCLYSHRVNPRLGARQLRVLRSYGEVLTMMLADETVPEGRVRERDDIDELLAAGGPRMVLQPMMDMRSGRPWAFEALARFPGERPPDQWFAQAQHVGRGRVLQTAAIVNALERLDQMPPGVRLSVNLSPEWLTAPDVLGVLSEVRGAGRLMVELTEESLVDLSRLAEPLRRLRRRGVLVALDDAGAGWSGLRQILEIAPDVIKIDRQIVSRIDADLPRQAMVAALVAFASAVEATVVAEGVETVEERDSLLGLGVQLGQGWLLGRPEDGVVPADAAAVAG